MRTHKRRLLYNTALLTVSSLLMNAVGMSFRAWLSGRIGTAGLGLYQLVLSVMKKELDAIVRLGALIGFVLGLLTALF